MSFHLMQGDRPVKGSTVRLVCKLNEYKYSVHIFKSDNENDQDSHIPLSSCSATVCQATQNYTFQTNGTVIEITINYLQRENDQKWWRCQTALSSHTSSMKQFFLNVISKYLKRYFSYFDFQIFIFCKHVSYIKEI